MADMSAPPPLPSPPPPFLQRHAQAQEALDALPAHRELVQQQQELQVSGLFYSCGCKVASCWQVGMAEVMRQQFGLLPGLGTGQLMLMLTFGELPTVCFPTPPTLQARISGLESDLAAMRVDIKASQDKMRSANTSIAALEKVGPFFLSFGRGEWEARGQGRAGSGGAGQGGASRTVPPASPPCCLLRQLCRPSVSRLQEREEGVAPELERAEDAITEARREVRSAGSGSSLPSPSVMHRC